MGIYAYIYSTEFFSIVSLILITINGNYILKTGTIGVMGAFMAFYVLTSFLLFKILEIRHSIKSAIKWNNKPMMYGIMRQYDTFNNMFHQIITPVNIILTLCYMAQPYYASSILMMLASPSNSRIDILLKFISIVLLIWGIIVIAHVKAITIFLKLYNKSIPGYFYSYICNYQFNRGAMNMKMTIKKINQVKFIMKIHSFIMGFESEFIGLRAINLMSFTIKVLRLTKTIDSNN